MVEKGGWRSLWRGNAVNCAKIFPEQGLFFLSINFLNIFSAIKYSCFEFLKGYSHTDPSEPLPVHKRFFAGSAAGAVSQTIIYPLEVVKTRMVLRETGQFTGITDCIKQIRLQEGHRAFYQGYIPTVAGILPYAGLDFLFNESAKIYLEDNAKWTQTEGNVNVNQLDQVCIRNISKFRSFFKARYA